MEFIYEMLRSFIFPGVMSVIVGILIARYGKTKQEKEDDRVRLMAETIDKMAATQNISSTQVLQKIQLIDQMEKRIDGQDVHIEQQEKEIKSLKRELALWTYFASMLDEQRIKYQLPSITFPVTPPDIKPRKV